MIQTITNVLQTIKEQNPLIVNITNVVTMDFIANGLLSLGASPVMSHALPEIEELLQLSKAAVINLGTLEESFVSLCKETAKWANHHTIPLILDPVGSGATNYRTTTARQLLDDFSFEIIRGNASEIMALSGAAHHTKGVDSIDEVDKAFFSAQALARQYNTTVVITGACDLIIDSKQHVFNARGSSCMSRVTGMGCLLSAVCAAFRCIEKSTFNAAYMATYFYSLCGELAEKHSPGPGTYKSVFLDHLSSPLIHREPAHERLQTS